MNRWTVTAIWLLIAGLIAVGAAQLFGDHAAEAAVSESATAFASPSAAASGASAPIEPIPPRPALDPRRVALGRRLFHDTRLSRDRTIACATCHDLSLGGADGLRHSVGIGGAVGELNAPTVLNSSFNVRQFWDGRAVSLEEQAAGPVHNPAEMGTSWTEVLPRLRSEAAYEQAFRSAYADGVTAANVVDAIATFERTLTTPNSRFDRHLRGDPNALTEDERAGYRIFVSTGCVTCHHGVAMGGTSFQRMGLMADYFAERGDVRASDNGRFNVTHDARDRHVFKVPTLRNVARTAPYFHDGTRATLEDAVMAMARYQLGEQLSAREVSHIAAFLRTLDGEIP